MTEAGQREWKADDPFDAMAEHFKREISLMAARAYDITIFREMDPIQQLECFMAGAVTAILGVCFVSVNESGRDEMMKWIAAYLPQAREQVEAILDGVEQ